MKKILQLAIPLICFVLGGTSVQAALSYWDSNNAASGAGTTPTGTWGVDTFWSTDPGGAVSTTAWTTGDTAVFSAGADAVNPFTVTVSGNQTAGGITFEEGTVTLSGGTITLGVAAVPVVATVNGTINSVLDGAAGLTKTGTGTLTLNGANTYTDLTTVSTGVIAVGNANALGAAGASPANTIINSGAAVHISGGIALAESLSITSPGTGVGSAGAFRSIAGSNAVDFIQISGAAGSSGRINIDAGTLLVRQINAPNKTAMTFGGDGNLIISPSPATFNVDGFFWGGEGGGVTKEGAGTLTLNGNCNIRGTFKVSTGTVKMGASGRFGNTGPVHPDLAVDGVFDMNGFDNAVDGLYGAGSVINAGASTLVICTNTGLAVTHNTAPDFTGVISGGTTLRKEGPRTNILSGVNTYSGNTIIKAGQLKLGATGSINNTPTIDVGSGASLDVSAVSGFTLGAGQTLMGNGTVLGTVTVAAGGRISPGASAGKLTVTGGLNLSAGGTNIWELAANNVSGPGTNYDQIVLTGGTLTLGGSSTLSIRFIDAATAPDSSVAFWQSPRTWTVISASGVAANFSKVENGSYPAGNFTTSVGAGGIVLTFTPGVSGLAKPRITSVTGAGTTSVTVNYTNTIPGTNYTLQFNTNLNTTTWHDAGTATAGGTTGFQTDNTPPVGERQRYYRLKFLSP